MNTASGGNKRKRACDYCKARRVICHPHPDGCPRCREKGLRCTTTIIPRRPRGKRAKMSPQEAPIPENPTGGASTSLMLCNPISRGAYAPSLSVARPLEPIFDTIPGSLVQDALDILNCMMPENSLLFPIRKFRKIIQNCAWDVRLLAPQQRVLTCCFLALASLVSVDPFYVGHDASGNRFPDTHLCWTKTSARWTDVASFREVGRRRKPVSVRLYGEAVRRAHQDGITSLASKENASSCFILSMLEIVYDSNTTMPWASAYIWQAQTLAEASARDALRDHRSTSMSDIERVQWHGSLLAISAYAVSVGKSLPFSPYDEILLTGPEPRSIEDILARPVDGPASSSVIEAVQSFGTRCVRLTRDAIENIIGATALQRPLDELEVIRHVTAAEHFFTSVLRFSRFIRNIGDSPPLQLCRYSTSSAFACLPVALYRTLRHRISESAVTAAGPGSRLEAWCKRCRALAARSVINAVADMRGVIAAHYIGMFQAGGFDTWAEVFLPIEKDELPDEGDVSTEERAEVLSSLREMIQFSMFTGIERVQIVSAISNELDSIQARRARATADGNDTSPSADSVASASASQVAEHPSPPDSRSPGTTTDLSMTSGTPTTAMGEKANTPILTEWWNNATPEESWADMVNWMANVDNSAGSIWTGNAAEG
ncbi:hypothetical protein HDZ31DRAFT_29172 [Schizophyllum fasciatum]